MKVSMLGSGSGGNSTFIEVDDFKILIDAGFSCKKIEERLTSIGQNIQDIGALLITHEHIDHIQGAGIISRKYDVPIYITRESYEAGKSKLGKLSEDCLKFIDSDFVLEDKMLVKVFDVMHDADRTVGFRIESQLSKKIAVSTDIGYISNNVREHFKDVDLMVIESNYDYNMLMNCKYPWDLKARVKSRNGHLSNDDSARFIKEMYGEKLKKVYLAHISKDSNHHKLIQSTLRDELNGIGSKIEYEMVEQDIATKIFEF